MRLVIARCAVDYDGRLTAHLPMATRLLMIKADGCLSIHSDGGAYKPLNWMVAPNRLVEEPDRWTVANTKGETLTITIDEIVSDVSYELGTDPGLQKDGVEAHLQELLAANCAAIADGCGSCAASIRPTSVRSISCAATVTASPWPSR